MIDKNREKKRNEIAETDSNHTNIEFVIVFSRWSIILGNKDKNIKQCHFSLTQAVKNESAVDWMEYDRMEYGV